MKVNIDNYNECDKSIYLNANHFSMEIDYDDVNHDEVEASVELLKQIIEKHWDEKLFKKIYKEKAILRWNSDKYLREEFDDNLDNFLKDI